MSQPIGFTEVPVEESITLINAFTVPLNESERFLRRWKDNARIMAGQPGFIRARMYRALIEDAESLRQRGGMEEREGARRGESEP
jgi:hypothetical protein